MSLQRSDKRRYFFGLGTNQFPEANMAGMIRGLAAEFGRLSVSSIIATAALNMPPDAPAFLNAAASCLSRRTPVEMNAFCKVLEAELGRDRSGAAPSRSVAADIDLLLSLSSGEIVSGTRLADLPSYLRPPLDQLLRLHGHGGILPESKIARTITLAVGSVVVGSMPVEIRRSTLGEDSQ